MLLLRPNAGFIFLVEIFIGEPKWRSGESARLPPMCPGFDSPTQRHMWVEFVVGSLLCSERFFSGYSGFPLSSKTKISKFQFDLDYCQVLHEPLARVIPQALPVFDIKFTFIYVLYTIGFTHFDRPSNLSCLRIWVAFGRLACKYDLQRADKSLRIMLSFGWRQINPRDNCIGLDEL